MPPAGQPARAPARWRWRPRSRGGPARQRAEQEVDVCIRLDAWQDGLDSAVRPDHEGRALVAVVRTPGERLLDPDPEGLGDRMSLVREEPVREPVFLAELDVALHRVG